MLPLCFTPTAGVGSLCRGVSLPVTRRSSRCVILCWLKAISDTVNGTADRGTVQSSTRTRLRSRSFINTWCQTEAHDPMCWYQMPRSIVSGYCRRAYRLIKSEVAAFSKILLRNFSDGLQKPRETDARRGKVPSTVQS